MEEVVIPWAFLIVSAMSGAFGSLLGIFLIYPQGSTLFWRSLDASQRIVGGGIAAGLWNCLLTEYSGLVAGKVGHIIGVAGGIGFAWWFIMGGVSIYLNRFRQAGPGSISLPGRFGWLAEILNSFTLKPPTEDKKIPSSVPPPVVSPDDSPKIPPPVVRRPPSVLKPREEKEEEGKS